MKTITISIGTLLVLGIVAILIVMQSQQVQGSAFTGSAAVQSVATTTTVGPSNPAYTLFSKKPSCTGRTITTNSTAIRLLTGDPGNGDLASTTLNASNVGLIQAASTTVMYDGGTYGCGRWTAVAAASTTITVVEYQ